MRTPMSFDPKALRGALGRFATGVTITTCRGSEGEPVGLTVNSFSALSLDPPLVLWSLRLASPAVAAFRHAGHFAINVLAMSQLDLSRRFASPVPDRFAEGRWRDGQGGSPVLEGACAVFECATEAELPMGDHLLFVGRVLALHETPVAPLLFRSGHYHQLGPLV